MFRVFIHIGIIASVIFSITSHAGSPIWKVSKGNQHLYLGGTMHLLTHNAYPLPKAYDIAYAEASKLVMETNMEALQAPENIGKLLKIMTFQNGETLQQALKPETYKALATYLSSRNIPVENFHPYTPSGFFITISVLELQMLGFDPNAGVDNYFTRLAIKDKKTLGQLEGIDEHISFLADIGSGREDELIVKTLNDLQELPATMEKLRAAWRNGDNKALENLAITEMKKDFPQLYKRLLSERNYNWIPKIERMLQDQGIELILVGAMHLAGEDGLIKQLRKRGYRLENI